MDLTWFENNDKLNVLAKCLVILPFSFFAIVLLYLLPSKLYIILIVILVLLMFIFLQDIYTKVMQNLPYLTKIMGIINMDIEKLPGSPHTLSETDSLSDSSLDSSSSSDDDEDDDKILKHNNRSGSISSSSNGSGRKLRHTTNKTKSKPTSSKLEPKRSKGIIELPIEHTKNNNISTHSNRNKQAQMRLNFDDEKIDLK